MPNGIYMTIVGNLTDDPELRFTQSGLAVANFTIANTPRYMKDGEWQNGETSFLRSTLWGDYAENAAESLRKGQHVVASGRLEMRTYEDREGNNRAVWELTVEDIGPSLRFGTTSFVKNARPEDEAKAERRTASRSSSRSSSRAKERA